jgi:hypothetical protein
MGRFKRDLTFYNNRWQQTEYLIADAYILAQRKPAETIEIAAHLMSQAFEDQDDILMDMARDLMRMAGSPCLFRANESAENATDNNNRPSVPFAPAIPGELLNDEEEEVEEEWDSSRDGFFNDKINPRAVKKAIDAVESEKITDRPFFFIAFTILKLLKYIPQNTSPRDFLLWVNLHFNCGWPEDPKKKHQLYFRLGGILKKLSKKHPSKWKDDADDGEEYWGNMNIEYYNLAISFKNVFTLTLVKGEPVDDSESFEHLRDRVELLSGKIYAHGLLWAPEEAYINKGK